MKRKSNGIRHVKFLVRNHPRQNNRNEHIEHGADHQRADNPARHVARRIFNFGCRCGNSIKTKIGEKDLSRSGHYAAKAKRHERMPV